MYFIKITIVFLGNMNQTITVIDVFELTWGNLSKNRDVFIHKFLHFIKQKLGPILTFWDKFHLDPKNTCIRFESFI